MSTAAVIRFIADEIISSVSAADVGALCDRLAHSESHGNDEQAWIATRLREALEGATCDERNALTEPA